MTNKPPPYDVDDCLTWLRQSFKNGGGWSGPNDLGLDNPTPKQDLSKKGLMYHAERDRDLLDVLFIIAIQLGYCNGVARQKETTEAYQIAAEGYKLLYEQMKNDNN